MPIPVGVSKQQIIVLNGTERENLKTFMSYQNSQSLHHVLWTFIVLDFFPQSG
jgi:hypothetical protein